MEYPPVQKINLGVSQRRRHAEADDPDRLHNKMTDKDIAASRKDDNEQPLSNSSQDSPERQFAGRKL